MAIGSFYGVQKSHVGYSPAWLFALGRITKRHHLLFVVRETPAILIRFLNLHKFRLKVWKGFYRGFRLRKHSGIVLGAYGISNNRVR